MAWVMFNLAFAIGCAGQIAIVCGWVPPVEIPPLVAFMALMFASHARAKQEGV